MTESLASSRDELALCRTLLANERTLLAYGRSAIMLAVSGVTLWKFNAMSGNEEVSLANALVVSGAVVACVGFYRYLRVRRTLRR